VRKCCSYPPAALEHHGKWPSFPASTKEQIEKNVPFDGLILMLDTNAMSVIGLCLTDCPRTASENLLRRLYTVHSVHGRTPPSGQNPEAIIERLSIIECNVTFVSPASGFGPASDGNTATLKIKIKAAHLSPLMKLQIAKAL
jgi:hypothetical protein